MFQSNVMQKLEFQSTNFPTNFAEAKLVMFFCIFVLYVTSTPIFRSLKYNCGSKAVGIFKSLNRNSRS